MLSYSYLMSATGPGNGHYVELPEPKFMAVLRLLLERVEVDEAWYRETYPDVDVAIRAGKLKSSHDHYIRAGYFENRLPRPIKVDERWYLEEYPDVAAAIERGAFASASQHFESDGFREGRLPSRNWSLIGSATRTPQLMDA